MRYFAIVCLSVCMVAFCSAATIHVPVNQPSIGQAIAAAQNGDTILVSPGVYTGLDNHNMNLVGKEIVIRSEAGPETTIIDVFNDGTHDDQHAFIFQAGEDASTKIEGFTIKNALGAEGGAIVIFGASPVIRDCIFTDNAGPGAAMWITNSAAPQVLNCRFIDNPGNSIGGAIVCREESTARFENCLFEGNQSANGAFLCWNASPTVVNCRFINNWAGATGGAVFLQDNCYPTFTHCFFQNNSANKGGAVWVEGRSVWGRCRPVFTECIFDGNSTMGYHGFGGAFAFIGLAGADISNCTFYDNTAYLGSVFGLDRTTYNPEPGVPDLVVANSIIAFNRNIPPVAIVAGDLAFQCTDIFGNAGGDWTDGIAGQADIDGNFSADPFFCDTALGDFGISVNSPCGPADNSCGVLIGAENTGCNTRGTVRIEKTHGTLLGHSQAVAITIENTLLQMGGFDFLIAYDASALTAIEVQPGQLLQDLNWEYFSYRFGADGNCGNACPSGLLRIIALAETNNGPNHPTGYGPPDTEPHELAVMEFHVSGNRTLQGQYLPIRFFWGDCPDNAISSVRGDTMFVERSIRNFQGTLIWDEMDEVTYPETSRLPFVGAPDLCLTPDGLFKTLPIRTIDYINGGIDVIADTAIDARGDINCNGLENEIADAVMFTNYFIMGLAAFDDHAEASIAASDVNTDGIALSVGDLVYLIRVITGDALPYMKPLPIAETSVDLVVDGSLARIDINSVSDIGAAYLTIVHDGNRFGQPYLTGEAEGMTLKYADDNGIMKILVYSMDRGQMIPGGSRSMVAIPIEGNGTIRLTAADLADYYGRPLPAILGSSSMPKTFALHQNYPNPFNNATTIYYEVPQAGQVTIEVYNIIGQRVRTLVSEDKSAGVYSVSWTGADESGREVASGIYLYRLNAPGFSAIKNMVLMK